MLITEVIGAFIVGYCVGALIAPPDATLARPSPRGRGAGISLPVFLGLVGALGAALAHIRIDLRELSLVGRAQRNALTTYIGWDARVIKAIPAGGFGEIAMRDGVGNVISVAATASVDVAEGTTVRVTGTRDLNVVVTPESARTR